MSSRNAYLNPSERQQACLLWQSLQLAERRHAEGEGCVATIRADMERFLVASPDIDLQYIAFLEEGSIREVRECCLVTFHPADGIRLSHPLLG